MGKGKSKCPKPCNSICPSVSRILGLVTLPSQWHTGCVSPICCVVQNHLWENSVPILSSLWLVLICSNVYMVYQLWLIYTYVNARVYVYGSDVFKYISTAQYYICNNKLYYACKSAFQFKHAFNFENLGKQMSMCKDIQAYTRLPKKEAHFQLCIHMCDWLCIQRRNPHT